MPRPDRPHRFHALGQNSLYERAETAQPAGPSMPEITGDKVMHQIAAQVGTWNIFILNAGHLPNPTSVASANLFDCWTILTYEVRSHSLFPQYFPIKPSHNTNNSIPTQTNAKSVVIAATAFLSTANKISYTIHLLYTPHLSTPSSVSVVTPTT